MKPTKREFSSKAWSYPLGGLKGLGRDQSSTFLEYGHVAYKIKGNGACSNILDSYRL